jgi:hypothetical protein
MSLATTATATATATDNRKAAAAEASRVLSSIIETLIPTKQGGESTPIERKNARVLLIIAYASIAQGEPCPMASMTVTMSDHSALPFKVWCARILAVDTSGKAHAVSCK